MNAPELSVVCRSCGEEVSPYVTECPYCGTRLRKRAPKLERRGDELQAQESRRDRKRRERAERRDRMAQYRTDVGEGERPYAVIIAILAPAMLVLVQRAADLPVSDLGAIVEPVGDEWWRYLAAPFVYPDVPYLFVCALGIAIFGSAVERRLGMIPTLVLMVAAGALGMLAADGIETAIGAESELLLAAGGNGVALGLLAAWAVLKAAELRAGLDEHAEVIGAAVCAAVLILLPLVEDFANVFAGLSGGLVGALCGYAASLARRERNPG
ncbi:MAG: rhomboid family intramembrane serine protease [Actinobacteria bacterium]|nr:rhomboid family intramembrane serine protease [Actinomycetota bacterium]